MVLANQRGKSDYSYNKENKACDFQPKLMQNPTHVSSGHLGAFNDCAKRPSVARVLRRNSRQHRELARH
jgi:hypothetical protein